MDYFNPAEAFKEGYAATEAVSSDIQSKDILRQAYADAPNTGSPQGDASVYNKAAQMAGMSGNASLAHTFQKQAGELSTSINKQKLDAITTSQTALEYATQQLPLASSIEDLNGIIDSTGVDPAMALKLRGAIKNLPLEQAKAVLKKVGTTVDTDLKTQKIALDGLMKQSTLQNRADDNLRADKTAALARINASAGLGQPPLYEDVALAYGKEYADKLAGGTATGTAKPTGTQVQTAAQVAESLGIPVSPKGGTRTTQEQADQVAQWYAGGMKGTRPAEPGTGKHETGDAIDVPKEGRTPENRTKLEAAGFINPIKDEPWHFERPKAVAKTKGTPTMPVLKKAGTGLPAERAGNILEATLQSTKDLINVSKLPEATTLNTFAGLSGKDAKGIVSGLEGAFARQVTTGDQRAFEQIIAGLESTMATAVGGGFASAASASKMAQYGKQIPRAGDNAENAAIFLARMKQELQTVREGFVDRQGANKEQVAKMDKAMEDLDKAIPFTIDQVMEAKAKRAGGKTMGAKASKTYGDSGKKSAADEAAAAGF